MSKNNKIELIVFDVNGTLIKQNSWLELNLAMGVTKEEDEMLMSWFYDNEIITYEETQTILERIYKKRGKATYENIKTVLSKYDYMDGAKEIIDYLKGNGYKVALISGSMDVLLDLIAKDLGIDMYEANNIFIFDENNYLDHMHTLGKDEDVKYSHLLSFCRRLDLEVSQCVCVGDGKNDQLLFKKTGRGITFNGSDIEDMAWKLVNNLADIKEIL